MQRGEPVGPATPIELSNPAKPVGPTKPANSIKPLESAKLSDPSALSDPAVLRGPSAPSNPSEPIAVKRLTVRADRVVADVALAPDAPRLTWPALMRHVCRTFPHLPQHACVNDAGDVFAAVMNRTSLPHLLEHLVIDLQVQAACKDVSRETFPHPSATPSAPEAPYPLEAPLSSALASSRTPASLQAPATLQASAPPRPPARPPVFVGTTEWTDEAAGLARIEVSFTDDLVALRAFRDATCFLNNVVLRWRHDFSTSDI